MEVTASVASVEWAERLGGRTVSVAVMWRGDLWCVCVCVCVCVCLIVMASTLIQVGVMA